MEKNGNLVVLLLVLLALGVGGWFVFAGTGTGGTPEVPAAAKEAAPADLVATPTLSTEANVEKSASPARSEVAAPSASPLDDPEIRAALAKFIGRVVTADGKPASDRVVRFYRCDPQVLWQPGHDEFAALADLPDLVAGEATTAADGRFELGGVWPRAIYLVKADATGANATLKLVDRTPAPAETVDLGDIVLENAAVLTGRVVDESGDAVAGAMVRAADVPPMVTQFVPIEQFDPEGWVIGGDDDEKMVVEMPGWVRKYWKHLPVPSTLSAADGSFRLEGVQPGVNLVVAEKAGFVAATQKNVKLDPGQERALGKLVLREGEIAAGKVIDATGKPLAGIEVIVGSRVAGMPVAFGRSAGVTDARGQFECAGFKPGDVVAAARRGPGEPWTITPPQSIQRSLAITLPARASLTLRLVSEVGRPIGAPRLALYDVSKGESLQVIATFGFSRPLPLDARRRDLDDGRIQIRDLDVGHRYTLLARATGHGMKVESVDLAADSEIEVRLPAGHGVDVVVQDGEGKPIARAAVVVELHSGRDQLPMNAGYTDAAGKLRVPDLAGESAVLEATHPRYGHAGVQVSLPAATAAVIKLLQPGVIDGEVATGDKPPEPGKYMVVATRPWDPERGTMSGMPNLTVPDLEGKFALRGLQPGKWNVAVVPAVKVRSFGSLTEMFMTARMSGDLPEQDVDLTAGQTVHVRLDTTATPVVEGPSADVSGTVFVDGRPGEGMVVQAFGERRRVATVDAAGQFQFGQMPAGQVHMSVNEADAGAMFGGGLWSKQVEVKAGTPLHLNIEVTTGRLSGQVVGVAGQPAPGVEIRLNPSTGGGWTRARTDGDGRFEVTRIATGTYNVVAEGSDEGRGYAKVEVTAGGGATVRIQLQRTFTVKGRIDLTALEAETKDEDQRWVWLQFMPEDESEQANTAWGRVDEGDGTFVAKQLLPGRYRVRVQWSRGGQWEHPDIVEVVDHDLEGLRITPQEKQPPKAPAKKG